MHPQLEEAFAGRRVLVTGHTGFKGSWLTLWLQRLGADVIGYSLAPPTNPSLFDICRLEPSLRHYEEDIRDFEKLNQVIAKENPEVIFHLAAQPLVITSFESPRETFLTNAAGTINLLEAARGNSGIKAIVCITSDKCYENREWVWGYRECDTLGGSDPYSASKAMAELAIVSYRQSFYQQETAVASTRAGNVIGGGDFSPWRLIPDCMRALLASAPIRVRNPYSTRPWLHVLDPLHGYLLLAARMLDKGQEYAGAWNFGPKDAKGVATGEMVAKAIELWGEGDWSATGGAENIKEMNLLALNWDKAASRLDWHPVYEWKKALSKTVAWYKAYASFLQNPQRVDLKGLCREQIEAFMQEAYPHQEQKGIEQDEIYADAFGRGLPH